MKKQFESFLRVLYGPKLIYNSMIKNRKRQMSQGKRNS